MVSSPRIRDVPIIKIAVLLTVIEVTVSEKYKVGGEQDIIGLLVV
jgi:hypothetical protein